MFCQKCGKELKEDALFCQSCGRAVSENQKRVMKTTTNVNNSIKISDVLLSVLNDRRKLITCGACIISIQLIVILVLLFGGKSNSQIVKKNAIVKEAESPLSEILGQWKLNCNIGSSSWASVCHACRYIEIVPEGIKGLCDIYPNGEEIIFYTVSASDVEVKEEEGVKYYYYTGNMETRDDNSQIIHIDMQNRLFINEDGYLQNQIYDSRDGYWQSISTAERLEEPYRGDEDY